MEVGGEQVGIVDGRVGTPVAVPVRTIRTTDGGDAWGFGDGSPSVTVKSDGRQSYPIDRASFFAALPKL